MRASSAFSQAAEWNFLRCAFIWAYTRRIQLKLNLVEFSRHKKERSDLIWDAFKEHLSHGCSLDESQKRKQDDSCRFLRASTMLDHNYLLSISEIRVKLFTFYCSKICLTWNKLCCSAQVQQISIRVSLFWRVHRHLQRVRRHPAVQRRQRRRPRVGLSDASDHQTAASCCQPPSGSLAPEECRPTWGATGSAASLGSAAKCTCISKQAAAASSAGKI